MYQLRTLWWRAHAHATNSSVLPVAATAAAAKRTSAKVPADRIRSVRFSVTDRFIALLLLSLLCSSCCGPLSKEACLTADLSVVDPYRIMRTDRRFGRIVYSAGHA